MRSSRRSCAIALDEQVYDILGLCRISADVERLAQRLLIVHQSSPSIEESLALRRRTGGDYALYAGANIANRSADGHIGSQRELICSAVDVSGRHLDAQGDGRRSVSWRWHAAGGGFWRYRCSGEGGAHMASSVEI